MLYTCCIISKMINKNEPFLAIEIDEKNIHVLGRPEQVNEYISKFYEHFQLLYFLKVLNLFYY
jgi:hypothetical protein